MPRQIAHGFHVEAVEFSLSFEISSIAHSIKLRAGEYVALAIVAALLVVVLVGVFLAAR